ncbi:MAG: 3'(2'),5'-bisphosphate nucleotidase [Phycisphaeraceae bacterium]
MTQTRATQMQVAIAAVRSAATVCRAVQRRLVTAETLQKRDKSPVTVADFASQAVVCAALAESLPDDAVVGEEDAHVLRQDEQAAIRKAVVEHVAGAVGCQVTDEQVLDWIDRGGAAASGRYWTLDPIDGTKGFLRGGQYAVALALIENGKVSLGLLGCPNLPGDGGEDQPGVLLTAERGQGARIVPLWDRSQTTGRPIHVSQVDSPAAARFCESVESAHSDQSHAAQVAQLLGITAEPVRMDSQCKYATVARGRAQIYLRLPTREDYRENIWDHAAGMLVVEQAGGQVTDVTGKPLDFTHGRRLEENAGIIATNGSIHDTVVDAVRRVLG